MMSERDRLIARRGVLEARLALLLAPDDTPDTAGDSIRAELAQVAHDIALTPYPSPSRGYLPDADEAF